MGLKSPNGLDSVIEDELGNQIRDLSEKIAHLNTYTDQDTGLLQLQLEGLIEQHKLETQQGE